MNRRRRKRPSLLPFGRTGFFIGAALLFLTVSAITYHFLKEPAGTRAVNVAAPPREPRGAVPSANFDRIPPVSQQPHAAEKNEVSPFPERSLSKVAGSEGEAKGVTGSAPQPQRAKETPPPSASVAEQPEKPRQQAVLDKDSEQRVSDNERGGAESVLRHQTGFIVQFGAYSQQATAERAEKTLLAQGARVTVDSEGGLFKVRVGPFKTREEAEGAANRLRESTGLAFLITKL